jgi:lipid-A-disaccharide synthase
MKLCVLNFQVRLNEAVEAATLFEPHVVVTFDSKGFSFRFLKRLRGMNSNDHTLLENCSRFRGML